MSEDSGDKPISLIPAAEDYADWFGKYLIVQQAAAQLRGDEPKKTGFDETQFSNRLLENCRADAGPYLESNSQ